MYRILCALFLAVLTPLVNAGDAPLDRATLRGVTAVNVVIDPIAAEIEKEGATAGALRTRLEDRLREGGIKIDETSTSFVGLRLAWVRAGRGPFAISATLGLYQSVALVRDRNVKTAVATWDVDTLALADAKQVYRACMDSVDELAGRLVTAYRSVNPAQNGGER